MTVLLIDGRSGSGKTVLAAAISAHWPEAQVVHMDDLYPGWEGLDEGAASLPEVLDTGRYRRWDWESAALAEEHEVTRPLIVEGVGALTAASRSRADFAIWVELDGDSRRRRALTREPAFAEHWDAWAAQERRFIDRENPASLADLVVAGDELERAVAWAKALR